MEQIHNGVAYKQEPDYCLIRERDQKRSHPIDKAPMESKMGVMPRPTVFTLVCGQEYIDPWNSHLEFDVTGSTGSAKGMELKGGVIDLIQNVVLMDKFGKELERCDNMHRLNHTLLRAMYGDAWVNHAGGTRSLDHTETNWGKAVWPGGIRTVVAPTKAFIPLPCLLGLFRTSQLLPPQLMDGLQIWIYWSNTFEVFTDLLDPAVQMLWNTPNDAASSKNVFEPDPYPRHNISNVVLTTDVYKLEHKLSMIVEEEYLKVGLPLKFHSWGHDSTHDTEQGLDRVSNVHIPIEKSYSKASKVLTVCRNKPDYNKDTPTAQENYNLLLRPYLELYYSDHENQPFVEPTRDYLHKNGRSFPMYPTNSLNKVIYYAKQAFGKNNFYIDPFSSLLVSEWNTGKAATNWIRTLSRNLNVMPNITTGLPGESNKTLAGVRVDGTNPIDQIFEFPELRSTDLDQSNVPTEDAIIVDLENPRFFFRRFDTFVEHMRYVLLTPNGNNVLI